MHDKIRVGYFSGDFRHHPVALLTAEMFESHDKARFETYAFSLSGQSNDDMRKRLIPVFDRFIDVHTNSDREIVDLCRLLEIDIAVDLGGFTQFSRPGIFALRAAPIQASYIGYLGTMAASYMDYLFADPVIITPSTRPYYSEKIAYLPSYQANDSKRVIADKVFTRAELGLPKRGFVYCCFNNNYKILPSTFDGWMRILKQVKNSVLLLYIGHEDVENNLKAAAKMRGVDPERIIFASRLPHDQYLARLKIADLFLDTFPYNAGTTASDALWLGLPVLTLRGQSFASRIAASLLTAIKMPELIADTQKGL